MWGLIYKVVRTFFGGLTQPLNKGEKDQPAPLNVQREHLRQELKNVEQLIKDREEQ